MNKLIVNVQTNEQQVVPLTEKEEQIALEQFDRFQRELPALLEQQQRQLVMDKLIEKLSADPTILDRLK